MNKLKAMLILFTRDDLTLWSQFSVAWTVLWAKWEISKSKAITTSLVLFAMTVAVVMMMGYSGRPILDLFVMESLGMLAVSALLTTLLLTVIRKSDDRRTTRRWQSVLLMLTTICLFIIPGLGSNQLIVYDDGCILETGTLRPSKSTLNPIKWSTIDPRSQHLVTYPCEIRFELQTDQGTVEFLGTVTADAQTLYYQWGDPRAMQQSIQQLVQTELRDHNPTFPPEYPKAPLDCVLRQTFKHLPDLPGVEPNHLMRKSC